MILFNVKTNNLTLEIVGYFTCASCKCSGNWNLFETYLDKKKRKTAACDISNQMNKIKEHISNITESTVKLNSIKDIEAVLIKFNLPVR